MGKLVSPTSFLAGIRDMTSRTFCVYSTERREHRFAGAERRGTNVVNDGERYPKVM